MIYYAINGEVYGVEIEELETDLVADLTFGSPVVEESPTRTHAVVVIWYGPRRQHGTRHELSLIGGENPLTLIERAIQSIIREMK